MTITRDIYWRQGALLSELLTTDVDLTGRSLRCHVRRRKSDSTIMLAFESGGPADQRIEAEAEGVRITLGAVAGEAVQTGGRDQPWVYDVEAVLDADPEDVLRLFEGAWIVSADVTRSGTQTAPMPDGDLRYLRDSNLAAGTNVTLTQSGSGASRVITIAATGGGGAAAWGGITGTLSAQTDLQSALDGKVGTGDSRLSDARTPTAHKSTHATGGSDALTPSDIGAEAAGAAAAAIAAHLAAPDPHTQYTTTARAAAAAPVQSVAAKTGAVILVSTDLTDFAAAVRAQIESALLSGTNITITPAGSGAARTLTVAASGGAPNVVWIGAGELIPRVTSGPGIDGQEFGTNRQNLDYLAFDAGTVEFAQASFAWPGTATTATARLYWTAASGSGAVVWRVALRCYADDDAIDQAFGSAQSVTDTLLAAGDVHESAATSAITPDGTPANRRLTLVQVDRNATDGADTLAVDARLIGVLLEFT